MSGTDTEEEPMASRSTGCTRGLAHIQAYTLSMYCTHMGRWSQIVTDPTARGSI